MGWNIEVFWKNNYNLAQKWKNFLNFQIVNCPAPLFRRLAKRHGETTGPNCLQASFLMSCRFQWRFHRLNFNVLNRHLQNSILCSKKRLSVIFHISEELLQWPPPGDFHRCLHWVVTLLSPTKQFCEAGEGPCAELHQSSLHLTGPPRKGDDLET